ncbi:MAG: type VI secretion system needle protein Hcp [Proteiniphilum sp.]|jgi:hypothetical protein|nr:type VI secretion system needle protein Hcp [Proteiniphilum sp.]
MFGHRSFLVIGGDSPADIKSLINGGYEILDCNFDFRQGVDRNGKATTRVYSGTLNVKVSQLPRKDLIEWALNSRKYSDGTIVMLDANNIPVEKIIFKNATCISFGIDYTEKGDSYTCTKLVIQTEKMIVGDGIEFENEWIYDK